MINNENMNKMYGHNPYFNRWFSAIRIGQTDQLLVLGVTILILIDGFLQYRQRKVNKEDKMSQSLFNRWFSAISINY